MASDSRGAPRDGSRSLDDGVESAWAGEPDVTPARGGSRAPGSAPAAPVTVPRWVGAGLAVVVAVAAAVAVVWWSDRDAAAPVATETAPAPTEVPSDPVANTAPTRIIVPAELVDLPDTEVALLTDSGALVDLSLPSGEVVVHPTGFRFPDTSGFVVSESATGFFDPSSRRTTVVTPDGEFVVHTADFLYPWPVRDGFLQVVGSQIGEEPSAYFVGADGDREQLDDVSFLAANIPRLHVLPGGDVVVSGDAGADRYLPDGSVERLTDDVLIDLSGERVLTRSCELRCTYAIVDLVDGTSVEVDARAVEGQGADSSTVFTASLAPDGGAVTRFEGNLEGSGGRQVIVDLVTGAEVSVPIVRPRVVGDPWLDDGSGVIVVTTEGRLAVLDRVTGAVVEIPLAVDGDAGLDLDADGAISLAASRP